MMEPPAQYLTHVLPELPSVALHIRQERIEIDERRRLMMETAF
jgi:hypothetical protein